MKSKLIKYVFMMIIICLPLVSCSAQISDQVYNNDRSNNTPVSSLRTGVMTSGVASLLNSFECTESGTYYMILDVADRWLLYCDHGSDEVIKLCGRPDCSHNNEDCNAYFREASNVCYYEGYLYTVINRYDERAIYRLNLDGSGRQKVFDFTEFFQDNGYSGISNPMIRNGVFTVALRKLDENGDEIQHEYFWRLDGSMTELQKTSGPLLMFNHGEKFWGVCDYDPKTGEYIYCEWNSFDGSLTELFRDKELRDFNYISDESEYYFEDGKIIQNVFSKGKNVLLDTGLEGNYEMACFNDCLVISEYVLPSEKTNFEDPTKRHLYFYDWDFNYLGSVNFKLPEDSDVIWVICGETHERIMLTDSHNLIPKYYINKSDFGSGSIEIHKFKLPDFE